MSGLYAGIHFTSSNASAQGGTDASSSTLSAAQTQTLKEAEAEAALHAEKAAKQAAEQEAQRVEKARQDALKAFAPVVRKRPAPAQRPRPAASSSASTLAQAGTSTAGATTASSSAQATEQVAPFAASTAATKGTGNVLTGRTLIVPPSMTLDDGADVNGFRATAAGKKSNRNNKQKKKKQKREDDPALAWSAEYDPSRPTDYNEYKAWSKLARAERRERLRKEKERLRKIERGEEESDYSDEDDDGDDSDEERRRRINAANNRFFAPPAVYDTASAPAEPMVINDDEEETAEPESEEARASRKAAEEAAAADWANWAGPSKSAGPAEGAAAAVVDDPYARRMALTQQVQSGAHSQPPSHQVRPVATAGQSPYGGAYSGPAMPSPSYAPPSERSPIVATAAATPSPLPAHNAPPVPPFNFPMPPANFPMPPSFVSPGAAGSASPQTAPHSSSAPAGPAGVSISEAQAKARAIAARLAALNKFGSAPAASSTAPAPPTSSVGAGSPYGSGIPGPDEPIPGLGVPSQPAVPATPKDPVKPQDFASNLMAKYGWSKGQGLGASSQGMLNPLALASDPSASDKKAKGKSKQQQQAEQQAPEQAAASKKLGMATSKGRVISDLKAEKDKEEKEKYGEPSTVVVLMNMVGRDEVDDELVSDVASEASKLGIVSRCFIHQMPSYVDESDAVRVFVVFSGLVGAWKAVKSFDNRFFGGRTVRAKFYSEEAVQQGALHL